MIFKELPSNWILIKVVDISEIVRGITYQKTEASSTKFDDSCLVLRGGNIQDGKIVIHDDLVYVHDSLIKKEQKLRKGDVIIVGSTGSQKLIGKAAFSLNDEEEISFGAFLVMLRPSEKIESSYFDYFFLTEFYRTEIRQLAGGININNIRREHLEGIEFPLPPLPEQQRIVAKLDTFFGQLDKIKTHLDRIPQLLKDFRQKVLTQAVTGENETFVQLNNYELNIQTDPFGSSLHKEEYIEGGFPVINPSHILDGEIVPDTKVTITESKLEELSRWILEEGDVILGRRGEMGRAAVYFGKNGKMICGTGSLVLKKSNRMDPQFLVYYLRSAFTISYLESNSVGSTMVNLNQKIIKSIPFPSIDVKEQKRRIEKIESLFAKADIIEKQYQSLKEKIEQLPQAILAKAFRGELVEQLPTDGDARELLEEIKKMKGSGIDKGKGKKLAADKELDVAAEARGKYGK